MINYQTIHTTLIKLANPVRAIHSQRFFKTGPGQYGAGDSFIGIAVPIIRTTAKQYAQTDFATLKLLLHSKIHEERLLAVLILVKQFQTAHKQHDTPAQAKLYTFYIAHKAWVNNWDLVDSSAEHIVGGWLEQNPKLKIILPKLAKSKNLWDRRIAILTTFHFIKLQQPQDTLKIATLLLHDKEDLIHKAVGWMLREVGKRCSVQQEEVFLKKHYRIMPRTMLRYAIEHFPEQKRLVYLKANSSV